MAVYRFKGLRYSSREITIESMRRRSGTRTRNLNSQILESRAQFWAIRIPLETGRGADIAEKVAEVIAHRDYHGASRSFTVAMPQPTGIAAPAGEVVASSAAAAGSQAIPVTLLANTVIRAGFFFTVGTGTKVYKVVEKLSATGDLKITPVLRTAVANAAVLDFSPDLTVRYALDSDFATRYNRPVVPPSLVIEAEEAL